VLPFINLAFFALNFAPQVGHLLEFLFPLRGALYPMIFLLSLFVALIFLDNIDLASLRYGEIAIVYLSLLLIFRVVSLEQLSGFQCRSLFK